MTFDGPPPSSANDPAPPCPACGTSFDVHYSEHLCKWVCHGTHRIDNPALMEATGSYEVVFKMEPGKFVVENPRWKDLSEDETLVLVNHLGSAFNQVEAQIMCATEEEIIAEAGEIRDRLPGYVSRPVESAPQEDTRDHQTQQFPGNQMREEIWAVIHRYGAESEVSLYTTLGVLEIVKADLIDELEKANEK